METRTGQTKGSDVVLELLHAEEEKEFDKIGRYLANDFTFFRTNAQTGRQQRLRRNSSSVLERDSGLAV